MPPRLSRQDFEQLFRALGELARRPDEQGRDELLARALRSRDPHLCARAARCIAQHGLAAHEGEVRAAFDDFLGAAAKRDPACGAKTALAEALDLLEHDDPAPFRRGVVLVQREGPPPNDDVATGLRARCGFALVRLRVPDALTVAADLLADEEPAVRAAGARAVAFHGDERGAALLRLKLHVGDPDPDVAGEVLGAYLALAPDAGLVFARRMLEDASPARRAATLLLLGESRVPGAFPLLAEHVERAVTDRDAHAGIVALFSLRSEEALAHLRSLAHAPREPHARLARELLGEGEEPAPSRPSRDTPGTTR